MQLEQELVRAEAQSLVAEAQLTNVTRQKFKEAYDIHTAAIIERAEKQILLARNARKLLNLVDDTPIVPGDSHHPFAHNESAREVLNVAEDELRGWTSNIAPIHTNSGALGVNAMPGPATATSGSVSPVESRHQAMPEHTDYSNEPALGPQPPTAHESAAYDNHSTYDTHSIATTQPPYPVEAEHYTSESRTLA